MSVNQRVNVLNVFYYTRFSLVRMGLTTEAAVPAVDVDPPH